MFPSPMMALAAASTAAIVAFSGSPVSAQAFNIYNFEYRTNGWQTGDAGSSSTWEYPKGTAWSMSWFC